MPNLHDEDGKIIGVISEEDQNYLENYSEWSVNRKQNQYRVVGWMFDRSSGKMVNNVPLQRIVMERKLGRPLHKGEIVAFLNGRKSDFRRENLQNFTRVEYAKWRLTKNK